MKPQLCIRPQSRLSLLKILYSADSIKSMTKHDLQMEHRTNVNNNMRICKVISAKEVSLEQGRTWRKYGTSFSKRNSN